MQTFKIDVGEAEPGQRGAADGNGQPPGQQGHLLAPDGHRLGLLNSAGKPSLTAQLRAMGHEGDRVQRQAFLELLRAKGRAA